MNLKFFTQPEILDQIGSRRLEKLFHAFRDDLATEHAVLPTPESQNGSYFDSLAATLESDQKIPDRLRTTLLALEAAASPENRPLLDSAIQRRIPTIAVSETCALDRALELWFHAPEEFAVFAPSSTLLAPSSAPACQDASISASSPAPSSKLQAPPQHVSMSAFQLFLPTPPKHRRAETLTLFPLPSPLFLQNPFSLLHSPLFIQSTVAPCCIN